MIYNTHFGNFWKSSINNYYNNNYHTGNTVNTVNQNNNMLPPKQLNHLNNINNYNLVKQSYYNNANPHGSNIMVKPTTLPPSQYSNSFWSRARCSTVKQLLGTCHGVKSQSSTTTSSLTMQPTLEQTSQILDHISTIQDPELSLEQETATCHQKPETSLNWEEQFVDLTRYCNSRTPMALIPDEEFATSSQTTEQRNGPDVFFGNEAIGSGLEMMLDQPSYDLLYKGSPRSVVGGDNVSSTIGSAGTGLKLNVDGITDASDLLNTPDCIKAFDDVESFDLIDYVFNEDKKPNILELDKQLETLNTINNNNSNKYHSDHSYSSQNSTSPVSYDNDPLLCGKQPAITTLTTKTTIVHKKLPSNDKNIDALKSINETSKNNITSTLTTTIPNKPKQIATIRPKRIKQKKMLDDYIYNLSPIATIKKEDDEDNNMDNENNEEDSDEYSLNTMRTLSNKLSRKRNISCSSTSTQGSSISNYKKSRKVLFNTDDEEIIEYESGKYRELRNRNNEASRRSRANRKNREMKMKEYADKLISDNLMLKNKSEFLEKQVDKFRNCLMKIVLKQKQQKQ